MLVICMGIHAQTSTLHRAMNVITTIMLLFNDYLMTLSNFFLKWFLSLLLIGPYLMARIGHMSKTVYVSGGFISGRT